MMQKFFNLVSMYKSMLFFLLSLWIASIFLSLIKILPYEFTEILFSGIYLILICNISNYLLAKIFKAKTNLESASITALILTLTIGPFALFDHLFLFTFMGVVAMASKYFFAIKKKHLFNPAAIGLFLSALVLNQGPSWWIGNIYLLPLIFLSGILMVLKIKRVKLVLSFLLIYFLQALLFNKNLTLNFFLVPAIWFFASVMLIEPLTSPVSKNKQLIFGATVAFTYGLITQILPSQGIGLEASLLVGNILSFGLSPSFNLILTFKEKKKVARNTWAFYFEPLRKLNFIPGQFIELTLPHRKADSRGIRRYFTISSSPTEKQLIITTKVIDKASSFKTALMELKTGTELTASNPKGDFVLPKDKTIPLAFIAGGIGITPFRSMIKYLLTEQEKRDIVLLYSNKTEKNIAFAKLFKTAEKIGLKTFYINTNKDKHITAETIKEKIPDYQKRSFYISGPEPMVNIFEKMISKMKVSKIKTDFFPGYTETHQK